ncbi:ferredoxin-dependent glutamate synthase [Pyrus ussuriensis x Pyrus communis]|uniref:Ferredoxin-dependent glutamate synthase n=1 Tax=Pyrus ussuriensis x Pyrus communis TaxID=2448454 RepID=A0A5N5I9H2_9ROSA|nr:ferredoxin-dependent glutamate synthase [Pyrus ussuriensis x Pyrus communis]
MAVPPPPGRSRTDSSLSISSACTVNQSRLAGNSEPPLTIAPSLISSPGITTRSPLPRINQLR